MPVEVMDERKELLEGRADGLGGTDISAVFGLNPWKKAIDVYLGKVGLSEPRDPTEPMYFGNALESVVRDAYSRRTGLKVMGPFDIFGQFPGCKPKIWNDQTMLQHPDVACVLGTPDGIVMDADRGLEIKTAGWKSDDWGKPGSDEVPMHYLLQCSQYMAITDLPAWDLAVLFHGNKLEIYTIHRDKEIEDSILNTAQSFWADYVVPRVPPPIDESESYTRYLSRCHKIGNQTFIPADPELERVALDLKTVQTQLKCLEASELFDKNQLMAMIGENKGAVLSTGDKVQWIRSKPSEITDYKALALSLNPTPGQIKQFTTEQARAAYVRLYNAKEK